MTATVFHDPMALVIDIFNKTYPSKDCEIIFGAEAENEDEFGWTTFVDGTPEVCIAAHTPYSDCVEILAHELAHVAAGESAEHGAEWNYAFSRIHKRYTQAVAALESERTA